MNKIPNDEIRHHAFECIKQLNVYMKDLVGILNLCVNGRGYEEIDSSLLDCFNECLKANEIVDYIHNRIEALTDADSSE